MNIPNTPFDHPDFNNHERILFFKDHNTGIKGIIAIHNTTRGPALGGCRMWPYATDNEALRDVLRLSRGMTYKAALANLQLGGGKTVLIGNPKTDKSSDVFKALAEAIDGLGGRYITAEDSGTCVADMQMIRQHTPHVVGLPTSPQEDDGDPAPYTSFGVYQGILAAAKHQFQGEGVASLTVAVQGLGSVGYSLCALLAENGANLIVTDIDSELTKKVANEFSARVVEPEDIFSVTADIFSPCALGGILNDKTIPQLKVSTVAGAANNQLSTPQHAMLLAEKGILYAPDYAINVGGLIRVTYESNDFIRTDVLKHIEGIYGTLLQIFQYSQQEKLLPHQAADAIAESRFLV